MSLITIEPVSVKHAPAIQRLAAHPLVVETTALPSPYPADGALSWIEQVLGPRRLEGREFAYAIMVGNDTLVGCCGFNNVPSDKVRVEIGYWVGVPYWGKGYATAGVSMALAIGFDEMKFKCIFAPILEHNRASQRVVEKLGFRHVRTYHNTYYPKWGEEEVLVEYELTADEWVQRTA
jgi:RimJ/RimL family protein N-acetyltransferase